MNSVVLASTLIGTQGHSHRDLARMVRLSELSRVRRGAYVVGVLPDVSAEEAHRRLIAATAPQLQSGSVISHASAAVLHRLPVWPRTLGPVHITRNRPGGGRRRGLVHLHGSPLEESEIVLVDGIAVTSKARTVLDLARILPMHQAVAVGDRCLAGGLDEEVLRRALRRMERWPGVQQARRTVDFLDPRSESAGESASRVRLHQLGLPVPDLQCQVFGPDGELLARADFVWEEQRTIGEFDGRIKYGRLLKPGQHSEDVVHAEKLREDALRDLGYQVVRWGWSDLNQPEVIRDRVLRAFARA